MVIMKKVKTFTLNTNTQEICN